MQEPKAVILVVEDHPLLREFVVEVLTDAGYETVEAANSQEAIAALEAHPGIRLVFTDVQMPGSMNGAKLAHYVRGRWPEVKLIVVSGQPVDPLPDGALFFFKPYGDAVIVDAMNGLLS